MKELENKVALVSSSTRGIGLACAKTLAAQGAAVYLGVRRLEAGQQIADELIAAGGRAGVVFFDASREESFSLPQQSSAGAGTLPRDRRRCHPGGCGRCSRL